MRAGVVAANILADHANPPLQTLTGRFHIIRVHLLLPTVTQIHSVMTYNMISLQPNTLTPNTLAHDGKKAYAVLTYEEFQNVREALADYQDLKDLNTATTTEGAAPTTPLSSVREDLGI